MALLAGILPFLNEVLAIKNVTDQLFGGPTSAASGAPVAAVTTPVILSPTPQSQPQPQPAPASSSKVPIWVWVAGGLAAVVAVGLVVWGLRR